MGLTTLFSQPYHETAAPSSGPAGWPQVYSVSIGGHTYTINTSFEPYRRDAFRHRSIQAQRESVDLTNIPGEGTVNTEGLWRRSAWDWHLGAGQPYFDRKGSSDERFSTSKGINPWNQWQLSLLSDTQKLVTCTGNAQVLQAGANVYVLDLAAQTLSYSSNLTSWSTVTFTSPPHTPALTMMATNGYDIWISDNANATGTGIWHTTTGASTATSYVTTASCDGVWWCMDRLMCSTGTTVWNFVGTAGSAMGSATTANPNYLWTSPVGDWKWTAMCSGSSQIYMTGYSAGGTGNPAVYRTTINSTGTALITPVVSLPLEGGERGYSLYGYLNFVFVGTNLGLRMCRTLSLYDPTGAQGDLEAGPLIPGLFPPGPVTSPVQCFTGNNRFLYFGWTNYDASSTGLGRCDLSSFIDSQAPAFTSDLMVTGQGNVTSLDWCTLNSKPIFVVSGKGVYTSTNTPVTSGNIISGYIGYGIADDKILWAGDIGTVQPQEGSVTMSVSSDATGNTFAYVGTQNDSDDGGAVNQSVFPIPQIRGEQFQVQLTLNKDTVTNVSPIVHRWMLKALPAITAGTTISVVLLLYGTDDNRGADVYQNAYAELEYLENLRTTQTAVEYLEGPYSATVVVDEIDWLPFKESDANPAGGFVGDCIVYLKTVDLGA